MCPPQHWTKGNDHFCTCWQYSFYKEPRRLLTCLAARPHAGSCSTSHLPDLRGSSASRTRPQLVLLWQVILSWMNDLAFLCLLSFMRLLWPCSSSLSSSLWWHNNHLMYQLLLPAVEASRLRAHSVPSSLMTTLKITRPRVYLIRDWPTLAYVLLTTNLWTQQMTQFPAHLTVYCLVHTLLVYLWRLFLKAFDVPKALVKSIMHLFMLTPPLINFLFAFLVVTLKSTC